MPLVRETEVRVSAYRWVNGLALTLVVAVVPAASAEPGNALDGLRAAWAAIRDYQASYVYEVWDRDGRPMSNTTGSIVFNREMPYCMAAGTEHGIELTLGNGGELPAFCLGGDGLMVDPAHFLCPFLAERRSVLRAVGVRDSKGLPWEGEHSVRCSILAGRPARSRARFAPVRLRCAVAVADSLPRLVEAADAGGVTVRLRLGGYRVNVGAGDDVVRRFREKALLEATVLDRPAPAFSLPSLDGTTVTLEALRGSPSVIEFFSAG